MTGKVTSKTGEALAFANVYFSDQAGNPTSANIGTTTNINGNYTLDQMVGAGLQYVTASYIGYTRSTMPAIYNLNFSLNNSDNNLPIVEIIGKPIQNGVIIALTFAVIAFAFAHKPV